MSRFARACANYYIPIGLITYPYLMSKNIDALMSSKQFHHFWYGMFLMPILWPVTVPLSYTGKLSIWIRKSISEHS